MSPKDKKKELKDHAGEFEGEDMNGLDDSIWLELMDEYLKEEPHE